MNLLKDLTEQLRQWWLRSTPAVRIVASVVFALALGTIVAVGIWSSRPQYVPLATNLAPTEVAEIVSALESQGIKSKLNFSGSGVLVPKSVWNSARVAAGELIGPVSSPDDVPNNSMFGDGSAQHFQQRAAKENELERTILQMRPVTSVDVHIAQPEPTPFARQQQSTTASVVLGLRAGTTFSPEQAATVVALVAGSVEGLSPDNVTVTDLEGRILSSQGGGDTSIFSQFDYRRRVEAELVAKAQTLLSQMLGPNKSTVSITTKIDFTETQQEVTTYEAEGNAKLTELISSETRTGPASSAVGPAGTSSNLAASAAGQVTTPISESKEETNIEYAPTKQVDVVTKAGGTITQMTVSAVVDLTGNNTAAGAAAPTNIAKEQIEEVIKQAVGFDAARGDLITVLDSPLAPVVDAANMVSDTRKWEFFNDFARNSSLGLAAVCALVLGLLTLRKVQPITLAGSHSDEDAYRRERLLAELSQRVQENPETVSRILGAWLDEPSTGTDRSDETSPETIPLRRAA